MTTAWAKATGAGGHAPPPPHFCLAMNFFKSNIFYFDHFLSMENLISYRKFYPRKGLFLYHFQ